MFLITHYSAIGVYGINAAFPFPPSIRSEACLRWPKDPQELKFAVTVGTGQDKEPREGDIAESCSSEKGSSAGAGGKEMESGACFLYISRNYCSLVFFC